MRQVYIEDGRVVTAPLIECTGVAARWCPNHGECTGVPDEQIPTAPFSRHCLDDACPLHSAKSNHAEVSDVR